MPIAAGIATLFPAPLKSRGDTYFRQGRVDVRREGPDLAKGTVHGSEEWEVSFPLSGDLSSARCECPFFASNGVCKHLWAALLTADAEGWLDSELLKGGDEAKDAEASWTQQLRRLALHMASVHKEPPAEPDWSLGQRILYIVDFHQTTARRDGLVVELAVESRRPDGTWAQPRAFRLSRGDGAPTAPDAMDRELAQMLVGATPEREFAFSNGGNHRFILSPAAFDTTLRKMLLTGRGRMRHGGDRGLSALTWDDAGPWHLELEITPDAAAEQYTLHGVFVRGEERLDLNVPDVVMRGGVMVHNHQLSRFSDDGQFDLIYALRTDLRVSVNPVQLMELLDELHRLPRLPQLRLPPELGIGEGFAQPVPHVNLARVEGPGWGPARMEATVSFGYEGARVRADDARTSVFDRATRQLIHRSLEAEAAATAALLEAGLKRDEGTDNGWRVAPSRAMDVATSLLSQGWQVDLDGVEVRTGLDLELQVSSGIDWFDVLGEASFGGTAAGWPELLGAVRRGERLVPLADGSVGLLPDEWMERLTLMAATGTVTKGNLRYKKVQAGLLDALVAATPRTKVDDLFARLRTEMQRFDGITPREAPPGFAGTLRPYQQEGLGWLNFLQQLGFGGCLADDMGLGKTVQALALLEERRAAGKGPSLVVVPNSLVFNWQQEAARFTPNLRVVAQVGTKRRRARLAVADADVLVTTYGTLRRDAADLAAVHFDYIILDEAQAIKNPSTASAKAARALRGDHRLAMTGTPVENRLSELWSLFEFLNAGVLGSSMRFTAAIRSGFDETDPDARRASHSLLGRALRPYILRRTKEQVAPELPERLEQTLMVDLGDDDRRRYDELREHYRLSLLGQVDQAGMSRSRVQVLEALLRLRQAACHPGLVNPELRELSSAKLDVLEESVREIVAEGHKVLVFSQFTSLLAIVRRIFDASGVVYEYLDGATRDRAERVARFQNDPTVPVFLISLKAGGLGLNLTAADYVFLLDPWWNPAVEAQAIDRTHRIGQTRRVFATRLIARDTVEEKVLQLQAKKRDLADAILRSDDGPLASLTRDDLELLLS